MKFLSFLTQRLSFCSLIYMKLPYVGITRYPRAVWDTERSVYPLSNARNGLCLLFSAKNRIYKQNTKTHAQSGAENSLFQFWLTITKPFYPFEETTNYWSLSAWWVYCLVSRAVSQLIMRVNEPTVAFKLVQLCSKNPKGEPWRIIVKT